MRSILFFIIVFFVGFLAMLVLLQGDRFYPWSKTAKYERQLARLRATRPNHTDYRDFCRNFQWFYHQEKEDQNRLRAIRERIEADPQALTLNLQLATYYNWLKTVPQEKAKIDQTKTIDERLDKIREIKEMQDWIQRSALRGHSGNSFFGDFQTSFNTIEDKEESIYPTISELAEFLESLNPQQLEILLGHKPSTFLYELPRAYRKARENRD